MSPSRRGLAAMIALCTLAIAVFGTGVARADSASNAHATDVSSSSAVLNGTIDVSYPDSAWLFQYGTTTSYGSSTPVRPVGTGEQQVSAPISKLMPDTTYYFRLVLEEDYGGESYYNADGSFTTGPIPGTVATTGGTTSVTNTSAVLNGVAYAPSAGWSWYFEYGSSATYGRLTTTHDLHAGLTAVSMRVSGLSPATLYHYRLVVVQGANDYVGPDRTFRTALHPPPRYGTTMLRSRRLIVRGGVVSVPIKCAGAAGALCKGRLALTARKRAKTLACARTTFSRSAGSRVVKARVRSGCLALVRNAPNHKLSATLHGAFSGQQRPMNVRVTLARS